MMRNRFMTCHVSQICESIFSISMKEAESWLMTKHTGSAWWEGTFPSSPSAVANKTERLSLSPRRVSFFQHIMSWGDWQVMRLQWQWTEAAVCILVDVRSDKRRPGTDCKPYEEDQDFFVFQFYMFFPVACWPESFLSTHRADIVLNIYLTCLINSDSA